MSDFEEILKDMCTQRMIKEERNNRNNQLKAIIVDFKCWCHSIGLWSDLNQEKFEDYKKTNNIKLSFWENKEIYEKYFGYKFSYDYTTDQWKTTERGNLCV